jgi:hypothetical protein
VRVAGVETVGRAGLATGSSAADVVFPVFAVSGVCCAAAATKVQSKITKCAEKAKTNLIDLFA